MLINQSFLHVALLNLNIFFNEYFLYIILINLIFSLGGGSIILLSGRVGKVLDIVQKVVTTVAA
jgi:hypothetical protein